MEASQELNFLTALLPLAVIIFIIALGVILLNQHFQKNLYQQKLEREELKNRHQQELLQSSIMVQEEEQKRIASDLHDELGAVLSIAKMHLIQLERQSAHQPDNQTAALGNVKSLIETAISSMRRISHELMPPQLETFGLIKTLESIADQLNNVNNIEIRIAYSSEMKRLPRPMELGLYRISMELINNSIKHAVADKLNINISREEGCLVYTYGDNGKGLGQTQYFEGIGHKSIEARISALSGSFTIGNGENGGFYAHIKIPLMERND